MLPWRRAPSQGADRLRHSRDLALISGGRYYMSMDKGHGHDEAGIPAGEFKQRCLAILDQVAETGIPILVTKRGRPVARVVAVEADANGLAGSVRVLAEDDEGLYSTGETWGAERGE